LFPFLHYFPYPVGAGDDDQTTGASVPQETAPFRVVSDTTTPQMQSLSNSLGSLTKLVADNANTATPIPATNVEDEKALRTIIKEKATPSQAVLDAIKKQNEANERIADPYEISVLHKIEEKMNKLRTAAQQGQTATATATTTATPNTEMLQTLIKNVRLLRKQAEREVPSQEEMLPQYKEEKRLRNLENNYSQLNDVMEDRNLQGDEFNRLAAKYRNNIYNNVHMRR
jgi:hypothetical protein